MAIDPVTERHAVVNFPVCKDNIYKIDVEETKKVIAQYRPELIIFGKSMVLHREPVAAIRQFVDQGRSPPPLCTIWPMSWVSWAITSKPFEEAPKLSPAPLTRPSSVPSGA
ncbi:MAG: hypothetical protein ACLSHU_03980 [Oscillospiraceae bacterium]